jgi:plasmid replication initiation protein
MNLAEMPLAVLADRIPHGLKTLTFDGQHGKLTITGSDAFGLPTGQDEDVILGLLQLTRAANNFTSPTVPFSRYELLRMLGRADTAPNYKRLDQSLNRWMGVLLVYEKGWFDNAIKRRVDAKFHILENVVTYDVEDRKALRREKSAISASVLTWNSIFFASCQADNLKKLDLAIYFGLESSISKRLYRFLDKRFYKLTKISFDLAVLALEHVGMSRNYPPAKIREKLTPAIEELEELGFIRPATKAERYENIGKGRWVIHFRKGAGKI